MSQNVTTPSDPIPPTTQRTLLLVVLIAFSGLTAVALIEDGLRGTLEAITFNWASLQIYCDLVLAVSVICVWMFRDARCRGWNPWPWIAAAFVVGMFSPLTYLLFRAHHDINHITPKTNA